MSARHLLYCAPPTHLRPRQVDQPCYHADGDDGVTRLDQYVSYLPAGLKAKRPKWLTVLVAAKVMRPISYSIVGAFAVGLTACGIGTGIQPAGPDAFKATEMFSPAQGGFERAKRVALADAIRFCDERGKTFLPLDLPGGGTQGPTGYTVTFRCQPPAAPEPQQQSSRTTPGGAR